MPRYGKDNFFGRSKVIWWAPNEIRYTREQVEFILDHLNTFRDGKYPQDPAITGFENAGWKASRNTKAAFITPAEIVAELDRRLLRCGLDWYLVNEHYEQGSTLEDIAKLHHMDYEDVWNRIQRAITYVASGPVPRWVATEKRRGLEYNEWIAVRWHKKEKIADFPRKRIRVS